MPDTARPLGAQISHMLKARGVDVIFGIPGVHNIEMYRGIEQAGITHILARHEGGAGFMADGYARASGRPGVAYVITGPGLTNIMTPMGQAYSDSVPMLVISSCLDETAATRGQLHQMRDQRTAAATVCDWSEEARTAEAAFALIDRALAEFELKRNRPKHVQIPISVLGRDADPPRFIGSVERRGSCHPDRRDGAAHQIAKALMRARRPIIVYGGGARAMGRSLCTRLAKCAGAATFTTYAGRGLVAPDHDLNFGAFLPRAESQGVFASADLVVVIGSETAEVDLWRDELGHRCKTIRVDIDPEVLSGLPQQDVEAYCVSAGPALELTCDLVAEGQADTEWAAADVAALRAKWRAQADAERPGIVPICDALRACLPDDIMIYSDMTQFAYVAKEVWEMDRPGHWHHPYGFGTLGYALPAAIGGAVARPGLPTLAIAGDYGLQYTIQELGTAVELGLPLPILVWDNAKLKEIEDCMVAAQIAPNAVVARNPDFLALARAYGAHAVHPAGLDDLQQATLAALHADRPTLIRMTPALTA